MNLEHKEGLMVLGLLMQLDLYTDSRLRLKTGLTRKNQADFPLEKRSLIRDAFNANPEVLQDYLAANPDDLGPEYLDLLRSWEARVFGDFTLVRYLKAGAVLQKGEVYYQVLGLTEPLEMILSSWPCPLILRTTLLPYQGRIVSDGLIRSYSVHIGSNIKKRIASEYTCARRQGRILTSLTSSPPVVEEKPGPCEHREAVRALHAAASKLRGGATRPLHSPALAMLRWATALASNCLDDNPDPGELRKQLGQISKAFKQLDRILWEDDWT